MVEQRYRYGARRGWILTAIVMFGGGGVGLTRAAWRGDDVRLPLSIHLTGWPVYVLALCGFGLAAVAIVQGMRSRMLGPRELIVTPSWIEAPRGIWSRETVRIDRARLRGFGETAAMGTRVLRISTVDQTLVMSNRAVGKDGYKAVMGWLGEPK